MSLFRPERRSQTFPVQPVPVVRGAGPAGLGRDTIDAGLRVSAVWACVRLLADSVSMMPYGAFTMSNGIRVPVSDPQLLRTPSADASPSDWVYMVMVSLLLRGNAYGHIAKRDFSGYPTQIELWSPDLVRTTVEAGKLIYHVGTERFPALDVWHVRAFRMPGLSVGLSPISYAATTVSTDAAIGEFAFGWFRDGAHPSAVLETEQPVNQTQASTIKDRFLAAARGREPMVLGAGVKYRPIQVAPNESQFLDAQKYGVAQIARVFGVPPEMIAAEAGNSMTYSNVEQRSIDFLTYSVQPWLTRLESAMSQLMPGSKHVRFDTSVLLRTDLETRVKAGAIAIASKQMVPDEVRAWHDLPPLTDAQKALMDLIPLTVSPTGLPKDAPTGLAPGGATAQGVSGLDDPNA